jgi:CHAT domain-containing protein
LNRHGARFLADAGHEALFEAQEKMRTARDELGRPKYRTRDWAAWVLVGEG